MIFQLRHPIGVLAIAVALIVGVFLHDAAQVFAAQALGDESPRRAGRLTASLSSRVDVFGAIGGVLVGYGWASPVEMNDRFRGRRKRVALSLAAGPLTYLLLCFAATAAFAAASPQQVGVSINGLDVSQIQRFVLLLAYTFAAMFVMSCVPVPPLDGGRIMLVLAPQSIGWQKARYQLVERNIGVAIALGILILPLATRIPSIVGSIASDVWTPVGHAVLPSGTADLGDVAGYLGVP